MDKQDKEGIGPFNGWIVWGVVSYPLNYLLTLWIISLNQGIIDEKSLRFMTLMWYASPITFFMNLIMLLASLFSALASSNIF
jgi:hypothetical protein